MLVTAVFMDVAGLGCIFLKLTERCQLRLIGEIDVDGAECAVARVREEAVGNWVQEFVDHIIGGSWVVVALRFLIHIHVRGEAETGQFALVVQEAIGHEIGAVHAFRDVVPVVLTHGPKAFAITPFG